MNPLSNRFQSLLVVLAALICFPCGVSGCGGANSPQATYAVTGIVMLDSEPLPDVNVTFEPESGRPAIGKTDAEGRFTLSTFKPDDGAVVGLHKIGITPAATNEPMPGTPEYSQARSRQAEFPTRYRNPATSGFDANVTADGENDFSFDLVSR